MSEPVAVAPDDDAVGLVIVSLDVFSPSAIPQLSAFEREASLQGGGRHYDLGTIRVTEPDAVRRADALEAAVSALLDLVSAAPRDVLFAEETFVRLFLTLGSGAQTFGASLVRRIADVDATVWIDA